MIERVRPNDVIVDYGAKSSLFNGIVTPAAWRLPSCATIPFRHEPREAAMTADPETASAGPIVSLIEWHSTSLTPDDARRVAAETTVTFGLIPGYREARVAQDPGRSFRPLTAPIAPDRRSTRKPTP